jgi:DNA/RNA endonuclease YhcR with UshA esterase domain
MKQSLGLAILIACLCSPTIALAATLAPGDAAQHVGENATVCGVVASAHYASTTRAQPTFLNLERPYPNQTFAAVIFGNDRGKFGEPEARFQGKRVCVTGTIRLYRGTPEIILTDPKQLQ